MEGLRLKAVGANRQYVLTPLNRLVLENYSVGGSSVGELGVVGIWISCQLMALVRLAADGLWLSALLGLPQLDDRESREVISALRRMTHA